MLRVTPTRPYPLHSVAATRAIEAALAQTLPPHTLMQRAGLAVSRLALAIAPHAQTIWIACGPGNNGGDGLEAAVQLRAAGKQVVVSLAGAPEQLPADAAQSLQRCMNGGIVLSADAPPSVDLCIDALLGLGASRPPDGLAAQWLQTMAHTASPVLAVDLPSGLNGDTGTCLAGPEESQPGRIVSRAQRHTLALLTLKPGLFTHQGRDSAGEVWWDDLGAGQLLADFSASAWLAAPPEPTARPHASHKGTFGDVLIVGGAAGMGGAAVLAADAALHAGAGRVYVKLLDNQGLGWDAVRPAIMFRRLDDLDLGALTVVCGCGGSKGVKSLLPRIMEATPHLVLDADALNWVARDQDLQMLLRQRRWHAGHSATVLTPHPLEAARLLRTQTADVQADRLGAATALAERFGCTVVLKGSGTVVCTPDQVPSINPTGNGRLATAGTGDVLAGQLGALLARGFSAHEAAVAAVWRHGQLANQWSAGSALTADSLARQLAN